MQVDIKGIRDPNVAGELLRDVCFVPDEVDTLLLNPKMDFHRIEKTADGARGVAQLLCQSKFADVEDIDAMLDGADMYISLSDSDVILAWNRTTGALLFITEGTGLINDDYRESQKWKRVTEVNDSHTK